LFIQFIGLGSIFLIYKPGNRFKEKARSWKEQGVLLCWKLREG